MKRTLNPVRVVGLVAFILIFALACQHENSILNQDLKIQSALAAQENSAMIAAAQDAVNTTGNAFVAQGLSYGRVADGGDGDDGECKPKITSTIKVNKTNLDSIVISGTLTLDFDADSTCVGDDDEKRSGKIIDSVLIVLSKTNFKSFEIITFQNYWRDSTKIDGTISVDASKGNPTVVKIDGTKIKYRDGSSSSWTGNLVFTTQRSGIGSTYVSTKTITGSWSGTTRKGVTFSANITKDVIFKAGCFGYRHRFIPVSGTIEVTTNGVMSTIDYGDGTCDRVYTITTAGTTTEHHLG